MLSLSHLSPALGASRFSQEAKKENIHQRKILETGCVPSVRSISFYCHLNKKTREGNLGFQHWRAGECRAIIKPLGCRTGECAVWGSRSPQRTKEWGDGAEATGTLQVSPTLSTWDKAWSGFRSSAPRTATAGTGESGPPGPHHGSRGQTWEMVGRGVRGGASAGVSLRPGSKEDTELSYTWVRAKLATATPPRSLARGTWLSLRTPT